ncbi:protoporphyrinogen oxidase [Chengkuizengella axinellae]|uniref:Coproporphyrinogen III oxidase n=1 Tax=Chengkuizengella axinellae TaxID=3064388 RepID=A0ABT9ITP1_9BACL|nr:protoporphyrinogen oxidase [Chengkuizengella sp. 2205SS18-9]MDP5272703.1 protoporphyrinogen oxidase [Chengkuizengella sp. 2205SS18-9]
MERTPKKVTIVGGGITGLSTAFYVKKKFAEQGIPVEISIVEKDPRLGGKIQTWLRDEFVIERGPDSFLARKFPIIKISRELGIEDQLTATNPKAKKNYILHKGNFHLMPPGLILGIPTKMTPFMKTGLISLSGKLRAGMDLILPRRTDSSDETLGGFLSRRLGKQVAENIAEPLLSGIYAGNPNDLSLKATFPQFRGIEKKYRSLILGMASSRKQAPANGTSTQPLPKIAQNSMFLTYKKGLNTLVDALVKELDDVNLITEQSVTNITQIDSKKSKMNSYEIKLSNGEIIESNVVILAIPPHLTADLFRDLEQVQQLKKIKYASVANVIMAFDKKDIDHNLDGSGFVIPRKEGRFITACTWTSSKWLHTAPKDKVLLRCYVGRSGEEAWKQLDDEQIAEKVRQEIDDLMGIKATPIFHKVTRLYNSMPQYPVEHLKIIGDARKQCTEQYPGIFLTGAGYEGVGIPDCIGQGEKTAEQVLQFIQ